LADDVRHGRLDVAMVGLSAAEMTGLEPRELATVRFVVLVPASHRLAGAGEVRLAELAGERFVDMLRGFGNRTAVDRAFDVAGIPRRVQVEVPDLTTVPDYVRAGLGVAVVPEIDLAEVPGVVRLPLADAELAWTLSTITLSGKRPSRAVNALLDLMAASVRA
jgi:DNA-binding transcriptional LysR family regulator